jgi:hypothetical protein
MSLTIRLVLLVLLAVLPSVVIQAWNEVDLRGSREREAREAVLGIARRQTAEIDRIAEGARQFLVAIAQLPQVQAGDPEGCGELFQRLRPQFPGYANFFATDATGTVICNSFGTSATAAGREYFDRAMREGTFVVGEYVIGRASGVPSLPFAYPIRDAEGRTAGIVSAVLDLDWLAARLRPQLPPDHVLSIADRNGTILVRWPNNEALRGRSFGERFRFLRDAPAEGTLEVKGFDEITYITGYVPPAASPYGIYVGVGRDKRAAFADLERATNRAILLVGSASGSRSSPPFSAFACSCAARSTNSWPRPTPGARGTMALGSGCAGHQRSFPSSRGPSMPWRTASPGASASATRQPAPSGSSTRPWRSVSRIARESSRTPPSGSRPRWTSDAVRNWPCARALRAMAPCSSTRPSTSPSSTSG